MQRLIIEFPSKEMMEYFIGQMSDGFGEDFCDFSTRRYIAGTTGNRPEHYEQVDENGNPVCFVDFVEGFNGE